MKPKKSRTAPGAAPAEPGQDALLFPIAADNRTYERSAANKTETEELLLPTHDEARKLCKLAAEIKLLSPWQWMEETDVFGVEDPDTKDIAFVSVMGTVGEYEAVAAYRGAEGIYGFIDFQTDDLASHDRLLEIPQVQLSFSEPGFLEKRDRELLKGSGVKFTGTRPLFRSYRPGFLPWFITLNEARMLIHALSQTLEMSKRFDVDPALFPTDEDDESTTFLVRVSHQDDSSRSKGIEAAASSSSAGLVWEDRVKRISRPASPRIETIIDSRLLDGLKDVPLSALQIEADLFIGPGRVGKSGERPLALYMLMLADRQSGMILGFEALSAEHTLNTMYASVPETIVSLLSQNQVLPKQIVVRSELLLNLLEPLAEELKIQLRRAIRLPAIDEATASMTRWLQTGRM
jgi:hypothetical protein